MIWMVSTRNWSSSRFTLRTSTQYSRPVAVAINAKVDAAYQSVRRDASDQDRPGVGGPARREGEALQEQIVALVIDQVRDDRHDRLGGKRAHGESFQIDAVRHHRDRRGGAVVAKGERGELIGVCEHEPHASMRQALREPEPRASVVAWRSATP